MAHVADNMNMFSPNPLAHEAIMIRTSHVGDEAALLRLASLDSTQPLAGRAVVAERAGSIIAARSLEDGREIADPFEPTINVKKLLRVHAEAQPAPQRTRLRPRVGTQLVDGRC